MNGLSWVLYLADVSGQIATFFSGVGILCGFTIFGLLVFGNMYNHDMAPHEDKLDVTGMLKKAAIIGGISFLVQAVIPSKETFYLIAGSEAGEAVVTSEQGQRIITTIGEVIEQQLEDLKSGGEEG